jgi:hypothetical protein
LAGSAVRSLRGRGLKAVEILFRGKGAEFRLLESTEEISGVHWFKVRTLKQDPSWEIGLQRVSYEGKSLSVPWRQTVSTLPLSFTPLTI